MEDILVLVASIVALAMSTLLVITTECLDSCDDRILYLSLPCRLYKKYVRLCRLSLYLATMSWFLSLLAIVYTSPVTLVYAVSTIWLSMLFYEWSMVVVDHAKRQ